MIDLRSDTVTTPTPAMLRAMTAAEVGDDVYGEDPSINRLEEEVAGLLGKEAAVFTPSGSMANQIAILLHTRPGDSVLCEEGSHTFAYEAGAGAALSGVQFDVLPFSEKLSDEAIQGRFRADGLHESPSTLILVENTHNRGRGRALPAQETQRIVAAARGLGLKAHCDGARLWNAAVATGDAERELAAGFDTVSVCFSKGLGAPVGSALAGSREEGVRTAEREIGARLNKVHTVNPLGGYAVGRPEDMIETIESFAEIGVTNFVLDPGCHPRDIRTLVETFAREVIPHFRNR